MTRAAPFSLQSSGHTHVGGVRAVNEDALLDRADQGLWAVADGMGGHAAGDVAARMIVDALGRVPARERLSEFLDAVEEALHGVNDALVAFAAERKTSTIGSTVAALLARQTHAICLWAGDSRIYRCRAGLLEQLTQDHALIEELIAQGVITRRQAQTHPQGNFVTRAVGAGDRLDLDLEIVELRPGDVFVLCSDGLDKEVDPLEIGAIVQQYSGANRGQTLLELALARGARDNVTVVTVEVTSASADAPRPQSADDDTVPVPTGGA